MRINSRERVADDYRPPEIWGGIECTIRRCGDDYCDQLDRSGHYQRLDDLDVFASLGISAIRYPVLWEHVAPYGLGAADWTWIDLQLERMRRLNLLPIVGLVHHGSGPRCTSLLDAEFPERLASYAGAVARRFPWVARYTPVNEPLTTARFSGLYGHWYPHARDDRAFCRALVNQCRAIVRSMEVIRHFTPEALLVQTEDLGKTASTPMLAYQAEFDNERRWVSYDLLCGTLVASMPMWAYLTHNGIGPDELRWFQDHPCAPDICGFNYYVTSERFLDHRRGRYPRSAWGGNGRHRYADVEAAAAHDAVHEGPEALFREAWDRFQRPLAITEAHMGGHRESQLRWLHELWRASLALRRSGVPLVALTSWSLLGSYDWNSLMTRLDGYYEPGAFDVRGPAPRPTAVARAVRTLAHGRAMRHPVLDQPGWWHREHPRDSTRRSAKKNKPRPLLIAGGGRLGSALAQACYQRKLNYRITSRQELDISEPDQVQSALNRYRPWAVINAAGYPRSSYLDGACSRPWLSNVIGPTVLAGACALSGIQFLTISSALVFDARVPRHYLETDPTCPACHFGRSKQAAEKSVVQVHPYALILRLGVLFSATNPQHLLEQALRALARGREIQVAEAAHVSVSFLPDVVNVALDLLIDRERGVWHLANGVLAWPELIDRTCALAGVNKDGLRVVGAHDGKQSAAGEPMLGSGRGKLMPSLEDALARYVAARSAERPFVSAGSSFVEADAREFDEFIA